MWYVEDARISGFSGVKGQNPGAIPIKNRYLMRCSCRLIFHPAGPLLK